MSQTLGSSADHTDRVRSAERNARVIDYAKNNFNTFQSALASVEQCEELWGALSLDAATRKSLGALFGKQQKQCEVITNLLGNLGNLYDRFLNLVWYLRPTFRRRSN